MTREALEVEFLRLARERGIAPHENGHIGFNPIWPWPEPTTEPGYNEAVWPWWRLATECLNYLTVTSQGFFRAIRNDKGSDILRAQWALVARAAKDASAILMLIEKGYSQQADVVLSSMIETLEFASALIIDPALSAEFIATDSPDASNEFWHRHISRGRSRKKIEELYTQKLEDASGLGLQHAEWRSYGRKILGALKHPTYVAIVREIAGQPSEAAYLPGLPFQMLADVRILQMLADICAEYASVTLLKFTARPSGKFQGATKAAQGGWFEETELDSYATAGHGYILALWIYYLEKQDSEPFSLWLGQMADTDAGK